MKIEEVKCAPERPSRRQRHVSRPVSLHLIPILGEKRGISLALFLGMEEGSQSAAKPPKSSPFHSFPGLGFRTGLGFTFIGADESR